VEALDTRFHYYPVAGGASPGVFQTPEEHWWWHSKPVARSLAILDKLGVLVEETGRSDGTPGFLPFSVRIKRTELTPEPESDGGRCDGEGNPVSVSKGDAFSVTKRRVLHAVAREALRRAEEKGVIEPLRGDG